MRLWNQIRRGGAQSCHPTDPSHPDHIAAGAKEGSTPQECPGAVILVLREFNKIAAYSATNTIDEGSLGAYFKNNKDGLTKTGIAYWLVNRYYFGGKPFVGGPRLPEVNVEEEGIGRI